MAKNRVSFFTLGCRVNQYESFKLAEEFKAAGWLVTAENETADVYIVNTCTVTRLADRKSRQYIRRMKRLNPDSTLVVMGCYPKTNPDEIKAIPEVDIVLGTDDKYKVFELLGVKRVPACRSAACDPGSRIRALLQIQSGCDRFCSYCIIPFARNIKSSKPLEDIISEAKELIASGYKEIVLTGINTALYDGGVEPVLKALNELEGDFRIRFGSLEPTVVDAAYVKSLLKYEKLCRHFHLSVQSGSDRIIAAMNRHYSSKDYLDIVKVCRDFDGHFGLTTDMIAGFPGESEADLKDSIELINTVSFLHVHAFPYSKRAFTKAAEMENQISPQIKKKRNAILLEAGEKASKAFREKLTGTMQRVLVEQKTDGLYHGHASNYCDVYFSSDKDDIINTFINIEISSVYMDGVIGKEERK